MMRAKLVYEEVAGEASRSKLFAKSMIDA